MAIDGIWNIVLSTPMGDKTGTLNLKVEEASLTGTLTNEFGETPIEDGEVDGNYLFWRSKATKPVPMTLEFELDVVGEEMTGIVKFGPLGEAPVRGTRAQN